MPTRSRDLLVADADAHLTGAPYDFAKADFQTGEGTDYMSMTVLQLLSSPCSRPAAASRSAGAGLLVFVMVALLCGCERDDELTWTEDVRLPDGAVITLKRWAEFNGGSSHLGDPQTESRQAFAFKHPITGEVVRWENSQQQGRLDTIALWLDEGRPKLLAAPSYGGDLYKYNCPNPPYLLYEYVGGQWLNRPLTQISRKKLRSNLTSSALNKREFIRENRYHLDAKQTADSYTFLNGRIKVPHIINFDGMPAQTFKQEDCSRVSNLQLLISVENK